MILEILIRKCGSAAIELVIPEKYKGFLKTVLEVFFFSRSLCSCLFSTH